MSDELETPEEVVTLGESEDAAPVDGALAVDDSETVAVDVGAEDAQEDVSSHELMEPAEVAQVAGTLGASDNATDAAMELTERATEIASEAAGQAVEGVTSELQGLSEVFGRQAAAETVRLLAEGQEEAEEAESLEVEPTLVEVESDQWERMQGTMQWSLALSALSSCLVAATLGAVLAQYFVMGWRK